MALRVLLLASLLCWAAGIESESLSLVQVQARRFEEFLGQEWVADEDRSGAKESRIYPSRVCVSIAAYEDPDWIDALLENALRFTEPGTHITVHLNSLSNYTEEQLRTWDDMDRVQINSRRVAVQAFHGGILYSHMLNVRVMPSFCEHVIMQASNMMWVRRGMEDAVRGQRYGGIFNVTCDGGMCQKRMLNPFFKDRLVGTNGLIGWGAHEGAFYPMRTVKGFIAYLDEYITEMSLSIQKDVVEANDDAEEWWLQTYMVNREPWKEEYGPTLSLFDTSGDSCSIEAVEKVSKGLKPPPPPYNDKLWNEKWGFYAVKRVARDLTHPVTKYIMDLPADDIAAGSHEPQHETAAEPDALTREPTDLGNIIDALAAEQEKEKSPRDNQALGDMIDTLAGVQEKERPEAGVQIDNQALKWNLHPQWTQTADNRALKWEEHPEWKKSPDSDEPKWKVHPNWTAVNDDESKQPHEPADIPEVKLHVKKSARKRETQPILYKMVLGDLPTS